MKNEYELKPIKIIKIQEVSNDTKLLTFDFSFTKFIPGQFLMVSVPGFGEAPFGIMQPSCENHNLQILVRSVGELTNKICSLKKNDTLWIRGPYGNGFPVSDWRGKNISMFAGGTGIVPLKALLDYILNNPGKFRNIQLFYGAKSSKSIHFQKELLKCQKFADIILTIEKLDSSWHGESGLITNHISSKTVSDENTIAALCGPPVMYKFVIDKLHKIGFKDENIFVSLERRMRCGIGKCQHCTCGDKYVCLDGPVFNYDEVLKMPEAL